jgi:hypothetical protein
MDRSMCVVNCGEQLFVSRRLSAEQHALSEIRSHRVMKIHAKPGNPYYYWYS